MTRTTGTSKHGGLRNDQANGRVDSGRVCSFSSDGVRYNTIKSLSEYPREREQTS